MLDIRLFRDTPDQLRTRLATRGDHGAVVDLVLEVDERRRALVQEGDAIKARRNAISREIPERAKAKEPIEELKQESIRLGSRIGALDEEMRKVDAELHTLLLGIPNLPQEGVPVGKDEHGNVARRSWGEPVSHPFKAKPHWELGEALGILDIPRATKLSGSGFYTLSGIGARLERVLIQWMLDEHTLKNGYREYSVPFLVGPNALMGTSQLPKFADQLYSIPEDNLYLVPTAEVPLTNLWAEEILEADQLPIAAVAHTPCFRREAGAAGRENRGISRIHQFHKVEMVHIVRPEDSAATHEKLVGHATGLLEALEVPYRILELCTGDMGFGAARCLDIEIFAPGMNTWLEVSSCSNFESFQSRRANIRYRPERGAKTQFVHTLNGSGLALPRLIIAILENNQRADGSIAIPKVLRERMGAEEIR